MGNKSNFPKLQSSAEAEANGSVLPISVGHPGLICSCGTQGWVAELTVTFILWAGGVCPHFPSSLPMSVPLDHIKGVPGKNEALADNKVSRFIRQLQHLEQL